MEVISIKEMRLKELYCRVRKSIYTYQSRFSHYDRYFIIEMVPENGSLLLGWWKVPTKDYDKCLLHVEKMLSMRDNTNK